MNRDDTGGKAGKNCLNDKPNQQQQRQHQHKRGYEHRIADRVEQHQFMARVRIGRERTRVTQNVIRMGVGDDMPVGQAVRVTEDDGVDLHQRQQAQ